MVFRKSDPREWARVRLKKRTYLHYVELLEFSVVLHEHQTALRHLCVSFSIHISMYVSYINESEERRIRNWLDNIPFTITQKLNDLIKCLANFEWEKICKFSFSLCLQIQWVFCKCWFQAFQWNEKVNLDAHFFLYETAGSTGSNISAWQFRS